MTDDLDQTEKRASGLEALRQTQAEAEKPSLDRMIDVVNAAAQRIEDDQMRWYEWGLNDLLSLDEIERAQALRGGAKLLELMKFSDQKAMRKLLEAARERMERVAKRPGANDTGMALRAAEIKGEGLIQ